MQNRIIDTDSYKASQWVQYPKGTEKVFSYLESRGTDRHWDSTVFFGLQYILNTYFADPITIEEVEEAREVITAHGLPFNYDGWKLLITRYGGKLPLRIRSVREGSIVPLKNVLMTIENTDKDFYWLTGWFETQLSRIWYPITVATQSYYMKKLYADFLEGTADDDAHNLDFRVHDFGSRGVSSKETAQIGGAAHLTSFQGTDTMTALLLLKKHYGAEMAGFSIPACYDKHTEILTEKGFKLFSNIGKLKVAQYLPSGGVEFVKPTNYVEEYYSGEMVDFTSNFLHQSVTPNHILKRISKSRRVLESIDAQSGGYSTKNNFIVSGLMKKPTPNLSMLDRLKIAFQADGSFPSREEKYTGVRTGTFPIRFSLKKKRKQDRLEWIIQELGLEYSKHPEKRTGYFSYWIKVPEKLSKTLDWVNLSKINHVWGEEFMEELSKWDGQAPTPNCYRYGSVIKQNLDVVQAVAAVSGFRTKLTTPEVRGNRQVFYELSILKNTTEVGGQHVSKSTYQYDGDIFCVTVPSSMIIIRKNNKVTVCGNSEHSTRTSWGRDGEVDAFRNSIKNFGVKGGIWSDVSDSWDIYNAVSELWGKTLKQEVIDSGATLVVRPDSGDPVTVVLEVLKRLAEAFGFTVNSKGYKVLNHVKVIQGDGIDEDTLESLLTEITEAGYSACNLTVGSGGALLQKLDRDTLRFAYKCSSIQKDGVQVDVYKEPITSKMKASKKGRLDLVRKSGVYSTVVLPQGVDKSYNTELATVFVNGEIVSTTTLEAVRTRINRGG